MLRWLTMREYNRFDAIWIVMAVLAWDDGEYIAMAVAVIGGAVFSGFLEGWNKQQEQSP